MSSLQKSGKLKVLWDLTADHRSVYQGQYLKSLNSYSADECTQFKIIAECVNLSCHINIIFCKNAVLACTVNGAAV